MQAHGAGLEDQAVATFINQLRQKIGVVCGNKLGELVDAAEKLGIVEKGGTSYSLRGRQDRTGRDKVLARLGEEFCTCKGDLTRLRPLAHLGE